MERFKPIQLSRYFNSPGQLAVKSAGVTPTWNEQLARELPNMPRGKQILWGIPFQLGPKDLTRRGVIVVGAKIDPVKVPIGTTATHLCVLHFCDVPSAPDANRAGGEHLADYVLRYADGSEHVQPIRRRFEVSPFLGIWGDNAFGAAPARMPTVMADDATKYGWGPLQTGVTSVGPNFLCWVYALENPRPKDALASLELRGCGELLIAVLGITLYQGPGHPLRYVPRRVYQLILPAAEKTKVSDLKAELDLGVVTRVYAVPGRINETWLKALDMGLGAERPPADTLHRQFLVEATGALGATMKVETDKGLKHEIDFGKAFTKGSTRSEDGKAHLRLLHRGKTWVHVTVLDASTGQPTPTRVHFCGPQGEYLPPYGHHQVVNDRWFEDYGGDLQLGSMSYAYVPGKFQIELPIGEVYVELSKGFEYVPLRAKLNIKPGQRELKLTIKRWIDLRKEGWVTADTHVHFISPQTAWLEGQCEGLNLINLLASQWGKLFTNVSDITGEASGCSTAETIVWVGTENRHHLLGHISMLGTRGDPVFPMCDGGPDEAYIGDADMMTLTEWAETCRHREGVIIRPHFPAPICEEPVYFLAEQIDGTELRVFGNPDESLDAFCFKEWYRYLNCGFRVAAVGGTDKMSAGMPVGGVRTYARLDRDDEFNFATWGKAVRAGRTFTSSGPVISLTVEGREIGDEVQLPAGGGTVEVHAKGECLWPMNALEVVANGKVVASTVSKAGAKQLEIKSSVKLSGSAWLAARCGSRLRVHHCWPIHLGAHTSPIYVVAGGQELWSASDVNYMLTLIDGGLTYLDTLSVRFDEERHRKMKAVFERAKAELLHRQKRHQR